MAQSKKQKQAWRASKRGEYVFKEQEQADKPAEHWAWCERCYQWAYCRNMVCMPCLAQAEL